ncbi:hypothetical protein RI820_001087 [Pluralibacter gergoviae]|nr:hypothetical protein [Pluralibacter gergoviae]ELC3016224.1 hypothetical protein [Pluralibacter gergoviae]ELC3021204.1 hypothetical protein [Pluralibacter gergoviae]
MTTFLQRFSKRSYKEIKANHENTHATVNGGLKAGDASMTYNNYSGYSLGGVEVILSVIDWGEKIREIKNDPNKCVNPLIKNFLYDLLEKSRVIHVDPSQAPDAQTSYHYNTSQLNSATASRGSHQLTLAQEEKRAADNLLSFTRPEANNNTLSYLHHRKAKNLFRKSASVGFTPALAHTAGINVINLGTAIDSSKNSIAHLCKLININKEIGSSGTIGADSATLKQGLGIIIKLKSAKTARKTVSAVFSSLPGSGVIPDMSYVAPVSPALDLTQKLITNFAINKQMPPSETSGKAGADNLNQTKKFLDTVIKLDNDALEEICQQIHFLAYKEQFRKKYQTDRIRDGYRNGALFDRVETTTNGKATEIISELLSQRGLSRIIHKYHAESIISEPMGWMVLLDKLTL